MLTLITGGARSGKSTFAQSLCENAASVLYVATATESDAEMRARIQRHRGDRPAHWRTVEEATAVPEVILNSEPSQLVLVDCITLWLTNLLQLWRNQTDTAVEQHAFEAADFFIAASVERQVIAVTNEVGSGIVPVTPLGRLFRDMQGFINQRLARAADSVYLIAAGIPLRLK